MTKPKSSRSPKNPLLTPKTKRVNVVHQAPSLPQKDGNLLVCGWNECGQLGVNADDVMEVSRPTVKAALSEIVDVKAGGMHSLVLTKQGQVLTFGCNDDGALGRSTLLEGSEATPEKINLPAKAMKISAGESHSACLLEDGRVFAWGALRNSAGVIGLIAEKVQATPGHIKMPVMAVDIASGNDHLVILAQDGTVFTMGRAQEGQLGRISERSSTGESRRGITELLTAKRVPKKNGNFLASAVWATAYGTFLKDLKTDQIYAFGLNSFRQLGVENEKQYEFFPHLSKFTNVLAIAGGIYHSVVLTNDHKVLTIGRKDFGFLGLGKVEQNVTELTNVASLNNKKVEFISCGECSTFALTTEGKLYVWGMGTNSQLGTGDEEDVLEPHLLESGQLSYKKVLAVSGGGQHSLFILDIPRASSGEMKVKKTVRFALDAETADVQQV